jgi:hypothetical protein
MIHSYDFAHCGTHWTSYSPDCGITFPNAGDPATCDPTEIWNDTDPKGTYVLATWSAAGTTLVQGCITIDPCAPFILCISNNEGDMPGNGVLIDCATPVGFNALNGGRVHCDIFQQMADLLWVDCTGDHTGVPPVVEAFCTWPAGAPALPVGVTFPPAFPESSNNPPPAGWPWAG